MSRISIWLHTGGVEPTVVDIPQGSTAQQIVEALNEHSRPFATFRVTDDGAITWDVAEFRPRPVPSESTR